jgi:hypothetical protein
MGVVINDWAEALEMKPTEQAARSPMSIGIRILVLQPVPNAQCGLTAKVATNAHKSTGDQLS